jgi:hypothetical protein
MLEDDMFQKNELVGSGNNHEEVRNLYEIYAGQLR